MIRTYTWGLGLSGSEQGAGGVGGLLMVHEGSKTHFVAMDGNGNVSALTDGTTVTAEYEYGPFGEVLKVLGEIGNEMPIRFSSKYQDFETGLVYYGFRYYSNQLGRWLNRDPLGEYGGKNPFTTNRNDLLNKVDPLGLFPFSTGHMPWPPDNPQGLGPFSALYSLLHAKGPFDYTKWYEYHYPNTFSAIKEHFASSALDVVKLMCAMSSDSRKDGKSSNIDDFRIRYGNGVNIFESDYGDKMQSGLTASLVLGSYTMLDQGFGITWDGENYHWAMNIVWKDSFGYDSGDIPKTIPDLARKPLESLFKIILPKYDVVFGVWEIGGSGNCCDF